MAEDVLTSINCELEFDKITKLGREVDKANDIIKKGTEKVLCLN